MLEGQVIKELVLNGKKVIFRYPRWNDLDQFIRMHREFHREKVMAAHQKTDRPTGCRMLSGILTDMEMGRARWLFLEIDGHVVGQGSAARYGETMAVVGLQFLKRARGMGLGRQMMFLLEDEARKLDRRRLYLDVWEANPVAHNLYRKLGYREIGRRPECCRTPDGRLSDLISMMKTLRKQ